MSPSNRFAVLLTIKRTNSSTFFDNGKGPAAEPAALAEDSTDDKCSPAFTKMSRAQREKLRMELFKSYMSPSSRAYDEPRADTLAIRLNWLSRYNNLFLFVILALHLYLFHCV